MNCVSECKGGLNERACHSKQKCSHDECRCECGELDEWSYCKDDYMRNHCKCHC